MNLLDLIQKHEGLRLTVYKDSRGILSIGYGRNLESTGISKAEALILLQADIGRTLSLLAQYVWFQNLDLVRQAAIVDVTFDVQAKILDFRKMITALIAKDWTTASAEMLNSQFAQQTGQRAKDDAAMLLTGEWPV